jgi:hypothetical protein
VGASVARASALLFDATDGRHQLGTIFVCNNSSGGRNADAGTPTAADPGGSVPINWVVLAPEQRFVLVVDRSGSMAGNKLTEARFGPTGGPTTQCSTTSWAWSPSPTPPARTSR